jgi:hypothetical protein
VNSSIFGLLNLLENSRHYFNLHAVCSEIDQFIKISAEASFKELMGNFGEAKAGPHQRSFIAAGHLFQ